MLQLVMLLLGCALLLYLWTISRTLAIALFGVTLYVILSRGDDLLQLLHAKHLQSSLGIIGYLSHSNTTFAWSLLSIIASLPSVTNLKKFPKCLRSGVCHVARVFGCTPVVIAGLEHIPLSTVVTAPTRVFEDISTNWVVHKADSRCIFWVLDSTTDIDVIFSTVRFAADTIWYPEIAGALSPHTLADLFFDCFLDGRIIPGKSEHAISMGMALASVLSVQLSTEHESETLEALRPRIHVHVRLFILPMLTSSMGMAALGFVAILSFSGRLIVDSILFMIVPCQLSITHKLWLARVVLQTLWRCRGVPKPIVRTLLRDIQSLFRKLMADDGQNATILKTNCFLIAAISMRLQVDFRDLS